MTFFRRGRMGNRMKLFFDARYIRTDFHDGISRYSTELGNALAKITDVTFIIFDLKQLAFLPVDATYVKVSSPTSPLEPFVARQLNKYRPVRRLFAYADHGYQWSEL